MNKFLKIGLPGLLLGVAAMPAVHAQVTQPVAKPISVKIGLYLPTDGSGRSQGGSTQVSIGADYAFTKTAAATPVVPMVYADYQGGGSGGGHVNLYDVGVGVRVYPNRTTTQNIIPYYGAGIGLDFLHANDGIGHSSTNTQIGAKVEIGAEMNTGPFVEADYQYVPQSVAGIRDSGVNIMIGDRF